MAELTEAASKNTFQLVTAALAKNHNTLLLKKEQHGSYVVSSMHKMGKSIFGYDVGHPWLLYYITNVLYLLNEKEHQLEKEDRDRLIQMLQYCKTDGFSGGHGQVPHLAPTYAAFLAILSIGPQAYHLLNKEDLYSFFKRLKTGRKFRMHENGQCDLRGIYIVAIIGKMLGMKDDIYEGLVEQVIDCQTYEGGLTNTPGGQAHGGYTFCGVAALAVLGQLERLDISRLMFWCSQRQVDKLGGFNGRTNKLIDSCYSFWVGAIFNTVNDYFEGKVSFEGQLQVILQDRLYDQLDLQRYLFQACQQPSGGMVDKPGKSRDLYHTAYALAGLSFAQHNETVFQQLECNELLPLDPIYNVSVERLQQARAYFGSAKPQGTPP